MDTPRDLVRRNVKVKQEELQNNSMQPHGQGPAQLRSVLRRNVWMPYQPVGLTFKKESADTGEGLEQYEATRSF